MGGRAPAIGLLFLLCAQAWGDISHGPVLGSLSSEGVAIWVRTSEPQAVTAELVALAGGQRLRRQAVTRSARDNTHVFRFSGLQAGTAYRYRVAAGRGVREGRLRTLAGGAAATATRIVFGACYDQARLTREGGAVFRDMARQDAQAVIFLGDLPYTSAGRLDELRSGHRLIRGNPWFSALAAEVPIYAIWDDHDFGENDADGSNVYKDEALQAFNEYWPNPPNETRAEAGIYTAFKIDDVEVFLLDTRYHARRDKAAPTLLGARQLRWLCDGLAQSDARYKLIASGVPLASDNRDGWSGDYFHAERDRLFACIAEQGVSGVVMISGDLHRAEVNRFRLGKLFSGGVIYDFTSSPLNARPIARRDPDGGSLVYVHEGEASLFATLTFRPGPGPRGVEFRLISPKRGVIKTLVLDDDDLGMPSRPPSSWRLALLPLAAVLLLAWFMLRRRRG